MMDGEDIDQAVQQQQDDQAFLFSIADRLVLMYGESPNADHVIRLRNLARLKLDPEVLREIDPRLWNEIVDCVDPVTFDRLTEQLEPES